MSLSTLAPELLLMIFDRLDQRDLKRFISTNHFFYDGFNTYLYTRNVKEYGGIGLLRASRNGLKQAVRQFLDAGADPNVDFRPFYKVRCIPRHLYRPNYDYNSLYGYNIVYSTTTGQVKCIVPNRVVRKSLGRNSYSSPAVVEALENGHEEVAEMLLSQDSTCSYEVYRCGNPQLEEAARGGHMRIVELLLLRDPDLVGPKGMSSNLRLLGSAVKRGSFSTVRLLLSLPWVYIETMDVVRDAEKWGIEMMQLLLDAVENGRLRIDGCSSELPNVIWGDNIMPLKILLAHPAVNPDQMGRYGLTPLGLALIFKQDEKARMLRATGRVNQGIQEVINKAYEELIRFDETGSKEKLSDLALTIRFHTNFLSEYKKSRGG